MYKKNSKAVKDVLRKFEWQTENETGVRKISGGFARAEIYEDNIDDWSIELKWGIQSDCSNVVHTELYTMDKTTLRIEEY